MNPEDPISLPITAPVPVLAVGGDAKASVCLVSGSRAEVEEMPGELSDPAVYRAFHQCVDRLVHRTRVRPARVACDMHPGYLSSRHARSLGLPVTEVQHHHAHVVSCAMENGVTGPVIGVCCDGTGFGTDGAVWGCEVLACSGAGFTRAGHLMYFPLSGGDAAARDTWRPAAGLLHEAYGPDWTEAAADLLSSTDREAVHVTRQRLAGPSVLPRTSSLGRLFDGVAFLLGLCQHNRVEGEAPRALEAAAGACTAEVESLACSLEEDPATGVLRIDVRPLIREIVEGRRAGRATSELAAAFHEAVAGALTACAAHAAADAGIRSVALSGGCFFNEILKRRLTARLEEEGLTVLTHCRLSTGDHGLALGQAVVAALAHAETRGESPDVSCRTR